MAQVPFSPRKQTISAWRDLISMRSKYLILCLFVKDRIFRSEWIPCAQSYHGHDLDERLHLGPELGLAPNDGMPRILG